MISILFFFNDTATTEIYTLSLHDALPISACIARCALLGRAPSGRRCRLVGYRPAPSNAVDCRRARFRGCSCARSEEHTSELQSRQYLVCRLLLEKKKT